MTAFREGLANRVCGGRRRHPIYDGLLAGFLPEDKDPYASYPEYGRANSYPWTLPGEGGCGRADAGAAREHHVRLPLQPDDWEQRGLPPAPRPLEDTALL